jgi:AcrR family transcriptional regulator
MARRPAIKPRKRASQERSRATVAALVEATARILVREGFDKASTNRIAEVAGVSVGSLYQYFPGKEALVAAVVEKHNRDIMDAVGDALAELNSLPLEQAVRRLVAVAVAGHRVDPDLHCVLAEQIPRPAASEEGAGVTGDARERFRAYLEARADELGVEDVGLAAFMCATTIEALAHNAVLHHSEAFPGDAIEPLIEETTRMIVGYLKNGANVAPQPGKARVARRIPEKPRA